MSDLYYQVSKGVGRFAVLNRDISLADENYPSSRKSLFNNEFSIFVFGHSISPKDAKSPLFICRNMLSYIKCYFLGKDVHDVSAAHLDNIRERIESKTGISDRDIFVIDGLSLDKSDNDDVKVLFWNLYKILKKEAKLNYDSDKVAVYMYLDESTSGLATMYKPKNCSIAYDDENKALILY